MMKFLLDFGYVGKGYNMHQQSEGMFSAADIDSAINIQEDRFLDWMARNPSKAKRRYCAMYLIEDGILVKCVKIKYFDNL